MTEELWMEIKLAEALLRRKELQGKVDQLSRIKEANLFEAKITRRKVSENIDDILAQVPKLNAAQVTSEYDFYARALRKIDAAIQQANWITNVGVDAKVMADWTAPTNPQPTSQNLPEQRGSVVE